MIRSRSGRREFSGALGDKRKKLAKMSGNEPPVHAGVHRDNALPFC
jgi:hypothetical protein